MAIELTSLFDVKEFYTFFIARHSPSVKKQIMTKEIKKHSEFIAEIESALSRNDSSKGMYLGDRYNFFHLAHYKRELAVMEDIRNNIV